MLAKDIQTLMVQYEQKRRDANINLENRKEKIYKKNPRLKEIEDEIKKGRYNDYSVIRDGKIVLINVLVFLDFMKYRGMLLDKNARKSAPPFEPAKLIEMIGWNNRIIREESA